MRDLEHSPLNLVTFMVMIAFVLGSFVTSDFFPHEPTITGHTVITLNAVTYNYSFTPTSFNEAYINDPIVFYISLLNDSTTSPIEGINCDIKIGSSGIFQDMVYNSVLSQYQFSHTFTESGVYQYTITCDLTQIGESAIAESSTITVLEPAPDFVITVETPGSTSTGTIITANVTITNNGPGAYNGTVPYNINFDDGTTVNKNVSILGSSVSASVTHTYSEDGSFVVIATVDPSDTINEFDETNNDDDTSIVVSNASQQPIVCGNITKSISMSENFFCEGDMHIGAANIVLDCNNFRIYGNGESDGETGIFVDEMATIRDCVIDNYGTAIDAVEGVQLENNSIRDSNVGLRLRTNNNSLVENIFEDNAVGIHNTAEITITDADFIDNVVHVNTTIATNLTYNFFDTTLYPIIESDIINTTTAIVIPYYDGSVRKSASQVVDPDLTGPGFNISVQSEEKNYRTEVSLDLNTSEASTCRYSTTSSTFSEMTDLLTTNNLRHYRTVIFEEKQTVEFFIRCEDLNDNPSIVYESSPIKIRSSRSVALEELGEEIGDYEDNKDDFEDRKSEATTDLAGTQDQDEKEEYQIEIDKATIEITYYDALLDNSRSLRQIIWDLGNDTEDIEEDYLEEYEDDIESALKNITKIEENVTSEIESESDDIGQTIKELLDAIEELYIFYANNETKTFEFNDYNNDHIRAIRAKEKADLDAEEIRLIALEKIDDEIDYDIYIDAVQDELDEIEEDLEEVNEDEAIDDFDNTLILLRNSVALNKAYQARLEVILEDIDEAIEFTEDNGDLTTTTFLVQLKEDTENLDEDLDDEIDFYEEEIDNTEDEKDNYGYVPPVVADDSNGKEFITSLDGVTTGSIVTVYLNDSSVYLKELKATINGAITNGSYIYIRAYNENPLSDPTSKKTIQWYNITAEPNIGIATGELTFEVSESEKTSFGISTQPITFFVTSGNNWRETGAENNETETTAGITSDGLYAIGYSNITQEIPNATEGCSPSWNCTEFSECALGKQSRMCTDINNCDPGNNSYADEQECGAGDQEEQVLPESCRDGEQNNDETGVDCGGSCGTCPDLELPKEPGLITKITGAHPIVSAILISIILVGSIGVATERIVKYRLRVLQKRKRKHAEQMDIDSPRPHFNYPLIDFLVEKLFQYEKAEVTKKQLVSRGVTKEMAEYMYGLTKYIFGKIENKFEPKIIAKDLMQQRWNPEDALHIGRYVTIRYLVHQIAEYYTISESNEEEKNIIIDILKSEGHGEELINKAFAAYEKNMNHQVPATSK